ncbi:pyridoxamine 5'-phosphate oxidase family protein [Streptomyces kanamyceticus]|uniref:TIGR03618 family F420-dependent PPOX class oxidoreductase n=1 Tax=Streptomyces kanamyceticus TaxID=1967 RepID=A0A5J6GG35_STRKN|nr:TIGR03618 family F420-dependent PPOX class oxidoreductase [Streptomyces kanamyceticus]QEU92961.1 TIGR03618 family F420-dependent PPOX class oxidoreductase [Streptomyces kanamyceticus]
MTTTPGTSSHKGKDRIDPRNPPADFLGFWRERHLCTLTTLRPDGTPHVVPVGVTYDPEAGVARVLARKTSRKVVHVLAAAGVDGPGARVAVCQFAGRRWATLEGRAEIKTDPAEIDAAERRYEERYERRPSPNPDRVLIEITVTRALGKPR